MDTGDVVMADKSIRPGFNLETPAGPGNHLTREPSEKRHASADFSPKEAAYWLDGYRRRLEASGGAVEASGESLHITGPRGGERNVGKQRVIDGRTVAGLNKRMQSLLSAGLSEAKAKEMALNTLAKYRKSAQAAPEYQARKSAKRERDK